MKPTLAAAAACLLAWGCAGRSAPTAEPADIVADGRAIAQAQCAACHAVGETGVSPRSDAPPFRTLLARYHPETLAEELEEGVKLGHPDMPQFQMSPQGAEALVAYLRALQLPPEQPNP